MLYNINDRPPLGKLFSFSIQMVLSVFVATVLIANICGVATSGALIGAALSTLIYVLATRGQSPMFLSNSGAFVAPVLFALAAGGYIGVAIGGFTACIVYCLFGLVFTFIPYKSIYKVFPPSLIGSITAVIGINLMSFITGYIGETGQYGVVIAMITMLSIAIISHYANGIARVLPFLIGILIGYAAAIGLTISGICELVDFSLFNNLSIFQMPDFAFTHWNGLNSAINWSAAVPIIIMFIAYTISACMECLSDHAALGGIINVDLYEKPGLSKIFLGEGLANLVSSCIGGLGSCSYGESVATIGFSKVSSIYVTITAAVMLAILGFLAPVQAFIASIPSCVFAGAAIILYGFIACSGIKMLQKIDLNIQKNLIIVSSVLSIGISGIIVGGTTISFSATALALIVGIILNFILK